jgi:hypothetical protein
MNESESQSSRYSTFVSILIAIVSLAGAVLAWRVAVASSHAGNADTAGLLAAVDREDATTQATIGAVGHQMAYAAFIRNNSLAQAFYALGKDFTTTARGFEAAANRALEFVPGQYLDRNDKFDAQRDIGEDIANASVNKDIHPADHFKEADQARRKAQFLLLDLSGYGVALVALTLADAIHNRLRYLFLLGGLGLFTMGSTAAIVIEALM